MTTNKAKKGRGSKPKRCDLRAAKKRGGNVSEAHRTVFGKIGTMLEYPSVSSDKEINLSAHRRILNSAKLRALKAEAEGLSRAARMGCHVQDVVDVATGAYGSRATNGEVFAAKVTMVLNLFERKNGRPTKPNYSRDWFEQKLTALAESSVVIVQRAFADEAMEYIRKRKKRIRASEKRGAPAEGANEKLQLIVGGIEAAEVLLRDSPLFVPQREVLLCTCGFACDLSSLERYLDKYTRADAATKGEFLNKFAVVYESARQRAQTMAKVATRMKIIALVLPFATQLATQCIEELSNGALNIVDSKRRFKWLDSRPEAFVTLVIKVIAKR